VSAKEARQAANAIRVHDRNKIDVSAGSPLGIMRYQGNNERLYGIMGIIGDKVISNSPKAVGMDGAWIFGVPKQTLIIPGLPAYYSDSQKAGKYLAVKSIFSITSGLIVATGVAISHLVHGISAEMETTQISGNMLKIGSAVAILGIAASIFTYFKKRREYSLELAKDIQVAFQVAIDDIGKTRKQKPIPEKA